MLQKQLVRRYDAYLAIGTANREFYRGYGVSDQQIFDAHYCIENARFEQAAAMGLRGHCFRTRCRTTRLKKDTQITTVRNKRM